jgi:hypothetical protein
MHEMCKLCSKSNNSKDKHFAVIYCIGYWWNFGPPEAQASGYKCVYHVPQPQVCFEQAKSNFWAPLRGDDLFSLLSLLTASSI